MCAACARHLRCKKGLKVFCGVVAVSVQMCAQNNAYFLHVIAIHRGVAFFVYYYTLGAFVLGQNPAFILLLYGTFMTAYVSCDGKYLHAFAGECGTCRYVPWATLMNWAFWCVLSYFSWIYCIRVTTSVATKRNTVPWTVVCKQSN